MNLLRQKKSLRPAEMIESLNYEKEDAYIADDRASCSPSEHVQSRLLHLMPRRSSMPVSSLHTQRMTSRYPSPQQG
jgi:hypothetical protein